MKQNNLKILYTGYQKIRKNDVSSSLLLLEKVDKNKTFLFTNDFDKIIEEVNVLLNEFYDKIIMFGQKPLIKDLRIEKRAFLDDEILYTNFDLNELECLLKDYNISYKFSENPGNSYCNYAYYQMLKIIKKRHLKTKVIFIHIPYIDKFNEIDKVVNLLKFIC